MKEIVAAHIVTKLRVANVAHINLCDDMLIIIKGEPLDKFVKELEAYIDNPLARKSVEEDELKLMESFIKGFGTKYPMIIQKGTDVSITYGVTVKLDISDPKFFDQLDAIIVHFLSHDDLSAFAAPA